MRRQKNLFGRLIAFDNLRLAFIGASHGRRDRSEVRRFEYHLEAELWRIRRELESESYDWGVYRRFWITDPKRREIRAAPFRDRVVHHALFNVIDPVLRRGFITDTYACLPGRGVHAAVRRYESFVRARQRQGYVLKCDIRKFFNNIDHHLLTASVERRIADQRVPPRCPPPIVRGGRVGVLGASLPERVHCPARQSRRRLRTGIGARPRDPGGIAASRAAECQLGDDVDSAQVLVETGYREGDEARRGRARPVGARKDLPAGFVRAVGALDLAGIEDQCSGAGAGESQVPGTHSMRSGLCLWKASTPRRFDAMTQGRSRMQQCCTSGPMRWVVLKAHPYRDSPWQPHNPTFDALTSSGQLPTASSCARP